MDAINAYIEPAAAAGTEMTTIATESTASVSASTPPPKTTTAAAAAAASTSQLPTDEVEDLKTDIPYFDDQQLVEQKPNMDAAGSLSESGGDLSDFDPALLVLSKTECDLGDYEPEPWDDVDTDAELQDNLSMLSSDYGSSCGRTGSSYYQSTTPTPTPNSTSTAAPTPPGSDVHLMLRPPSNSSYHYNYQSPSPPMQLRQLSTNRSYAAGAAAYSHSQTLQGQLAPPSLPPPHGFYPNMWYPNTTHGPGGSAAAVGSLPSAAAYGRYAAYAGSSTYSGSAAHLHAHQHHATHHGGGHHHHPHGHPHAHPHDTMMEMFQLSNSGREARNRAEKNRRDKLNGSIQELSTMVPHVAESPRRVDKTAVLRFAAHGLRLKYVFGKTLHQQRPQITDTLMSMLDSFFVTLTCHGQILLISSSIEQHLGHCQTDLYGQNILQITHPEDQNMLKQQLIPTELENLFDAHGETTDADGEPRQRSKTEDDYIDRKLREDKRSFRVRLARAGPRSEPTAYEVVKFDGCFRRSDEAPRGVKSNTFSSSLQLIRRTRGRDDAIPLHSISGNDIVLTACARIIRPPKIASRLIDANAMEYRTRHLIDGRIIDCEQRIGIVAGYMTDEVRNLSPFTFIHNDDVRWVIVALRQMYDCNCSYGESTYRLFTRNGNIIYLQSKGYLEIDKETNKVHSFVCVNTLLDEEEGKRRVQEMKKKFSVIINTKIPQSTVDVPASEHPAQLEKAVMRLIQNLQKSATDNALTGGNDCGHADGGKYASIDELADDDDDDGDDNDDDDDDASNDEGSMAHYANYSGRSAQRAQRPQHGHSASSTTVSQARLAAAHGMGSAKTPPLALVPPEAASVKSSISKSVSVVSVMAAKHLRATQQSAVKSPSSQATPTLQESVTDIDCGYCKSPLTPDSGAAAATAAGLGMGGSLKRNAALEAEDIKLQASKRRFMPSTEIEHVLSSSLVQIERTLHQQLNAAMELRDQGNRYEVPHANQRIDEIMEEHQKQSELYVNIKSEYEVQLQNKVNTTKAESDPHSSNAGAGGGHSCAH